MGNLLDGICVVELGTHMAVPLAARLLADWGAEVIKVEPPKGEAWRTIARTYNVPFASDNDPIFQVPNGNKKSIAINLKSEDGMEVMRRLIVKADIFISNTRLKSLTKLGLDYESIKKLNPGIIFAHFNGYGPNGPEKERPGFDIAAYWAKAGMPVEWTIKEQTPFRPMPGFGDSTVASSLTASVLAALHRKLVTGEGEFIQASLYGCALWYNNVGVVASQPRYNGSYPHSKYEQTSPYNTVFCSSDGTYFLFSIPYWNSFAEKFLQRFGLEKWIGDRRFMTVEGTKTDMQTVMDTLQEAFGRMTIDEICQAFTELDVVFEVFVNPCNVTNDEQAWANNYLIKATMECGDEVIISNNPLKFHNAQTLEFHLAPQLGADTKAILSKLGYTQTDIDKFIHDKSVAVLHE